MLDIDMDMLQKYFVLAVVGMVVNRSYDVFAHLNVI